MTGTIRDKISFRSGTAGDVQALVSIVQTDEPVRRFEFHWRSRKVPTAPARIYRTLAGAGIFGRSKLTSADLKLEFELCDEDMRGEAHSGFAKYFAHHLDLVDRGWSAKVADQPVERAKEIASRPDGFRASMLLELG
jgi:hypothetical protein